MPLSPLTRLLTLLTLIAFPVVFVTMVDPKSWLAPGSLGIALSLWTAALFGIVKSGAAFDERAFHSTRPRGRGIALYRSTSVMLGVIVWVTLVVLFRGWYFNLGWRATWAGASITFSLLFIITFAVATGFNLAFSRSRATRWVGWIMVALPIVTHLVIVEYHHDKPWPGADLYESWTMNLTLGAIISTVAYGIAWWLASRRFWWPGLVLCGIAGVCLSLPAIRMPLLGAKPAELPLSSVTIERLPLLKPIEKGEISSGKICSLDPEDLFTLTGLRDDEVFLAEEILPLPVVKDDLSWSVITTGSGVSRFRVTRWKAMEDSPPGKRSTTPLFASQLPDRPKVGWDGSDFGETVRFHQAEAEAVLAGLNEGDWQLSGHIRRIVHEGSFGLFTGGHKTLKETGVFRMLPAVEACTSFQFNCSFTLPGHDFDPLAEDMDTGIIPWRVPNLFLLLVNRSRTKASSFDMVRYEQGSGLASLWRKQTVQINKSESPEWSEEELEGAQVHLFTTRPVSRFHVVLPPPAGLPK